MEVLETITNVILTFGLGILMACFGMLIFLFEQGIENAEEDDYK